MADPFIAQILMFAGNFAPNGWAMCNGQLLPISQNTALFSLLGTFYGGDGRTTFALPNLQGSGPMHQGQGSGLSDRTVGETGGSDTVTLLQSEIPAHPHTVSGKSGAFPPGNNNPTNTSWGTSNDRPYNPLGGTAVTMSPTALSLAGGSLPHNNLMPYLMVNFIIAMQGVFPPRG